MKDITKKVFMMEKIYINIPMVIYINMKEKKGKKHGEGTYINKNLCKLSKESEERKVLLTNVRLAKPTPGFCIRVKNIVLNILHKGKSIYKYKI